MRNPHLGLRDRGAGPRKTHLQKCENGGTKQETKIEIAAVKRCLLAGEAPYREGPLDLSIFPHAYFYGNGGVKVPIILQDEGINGTVTIRRFKPRNTRELAIAGDRFAQLFDL